MNSPLDSDKPLSPALFQIAARADDPEMLRAYKKSLASGHALHAEKMLNPEKLTAILNALVRRKKPSSRRPAASRLDKRLSVMDGQIA